MITILERFMKLGQPVRLTTTAVRNGENVGITGRIVEITRDPINPSVTIEWSSNKPHVSRKGYVTYSIRHIVIAQCWGDQGPAGPSVWPDFHGHGGSYD